MSDASKVDHHSDGEPFTRRLDAAIAALAGRQHGVVARSQLVELGLGRGAIELRLRRGRVHLLHRAVYAVGHRVLTREGRWMAAVLAVGPDAVLSHRDAAALWGIRADNRSWIDVTTPRRALKRPGIDIHHARLPADEITTHHGIPVTTPDRTQLDLAAVVPRHQAERAMNEAHRLRIADAVSLDALVARYPGRPGTPAVKGILAERGLGATITRSELEARFLAFLDAHGFPRPETNVWLRELGIEVDCLWRAERLVVELDGRAWHDDPAAFEADRERDAELQAAGLRPLRFTWHRLHRKPDAVEANLAAFLARELCPVPRGRSGRGAAAPRNATPGRGDKPAWTSCT